MRRPLLPASVTLAFSTTLALLVLSNAPALASDGVLEINQTCAVQTGCFPGDAAGFPVTIDGSAGRSYRLTGDLTISDANTTGISLTSGWITVDLNGFSIIGPVTCSGEPNVCSPATGSGSGISSTSFDNTGLSVRNGTVRGMGYFGVSLSDGAIVESVRAIENRATGINVASGTVRRSTALRNGGDGIQAYQSSVIEGSSSYRNGDDGIVGLYGVTVQGNSAFANAGDGIVIYSGSIATGNTSRWNAGYGIRGTFEQDSGYRGNTISTNEGSTGTVTYGTNLGDNLCDGGTCP